MKDIAIHIAARYGVGAVNDPRHPQFAPRCDYSLWRAGGIFLEREVLLALMACHGPTDSGCLSNIWREIYPNSTGLNLSMHRTWVWLMAFLVLLAQRHLDDISACVAISLGRREPSRNIEDSPWLVDRKLLCYRFAVRISASIAAFAQPFSQLTSDIASGNGGRQRASRSNRRIGGPDAMIADRLCFLRGVAAIHVMARPTKAAAHLPPSRRAPAQGAAGRGAVRPVQSRALFHGRLALPDRAAGRGDPQDARRCTRRHGDCARGRRAAAAARRRHLAVRPDGGPGAGDGLFQAPEQADRGRMRPPAPAWSSRASCSTSSTASSGPPACGFRSTCRRPAAPPSAAWPATTPAAPARSATASCATTCWPSTRSLPTAPRRASPRSATTSRHLLQLPPSPSRGGVGGGGPLARRRVGLPHP